jgi:methyl-accepting chemotaxis protein-1 (serine sensor receptor)
MLDDGMAESSDRGRALVAAIAQVEQTYGPVALKIVDLVVNQRQDEAISMMNDECRPLLARLESAVRDYVDYSEAQARATSQEAVQAHAVQRNLLLAACLAAFAAAALSGAWLMRSLRRALGTEPAGLSAAARRVADGDLGPVPDAANATPGSVLASLAAMQEALADIVGQVRGAAGQIATGSDQIAAASAALSQQTEEQASNLMQTSSHMDPLADAVRNCAEAAHQASQMARSAAQVATRGGELVAQVVSTMAEIQASSNRIADITGTIDGIAFQTNILALNASVEAARAGDQGKGFAVVAAEVRNLAQRSAVAAKEIKQLIAASVDRVQTGAGIVDEAGTTMQHIQASVQQVSVTIADISAMARDQSQGIDGINSAMSELETMTQRNAAMAEESAATADSLKDQASRLSALVDSFHLGEAAAVQAPEPVRAVPQPARLAPQPAALVMPALQGISR